jgi:hypothetical protein
MPDKTAVRFLANIGNYFLILSMTFALAGVLTSTEAAPLSIADFLLSSIFSLIFALPIISWGGIVVVALVGVDRLAWKYTRATHRLILVIGSAALVGVPIGVFSGDLEVGLIHAFGGAIFGLAFRSAFPPGLG